MTDVDRVFTLDELSALVELPKRTIRYYIQIGLLDRPIGETRAAHYSSAHLDRLLRVRQLSQAGVALERIREVLSGALPPVLPKPRGAGSVEVWSHLVLGDGVELMVDPQRAELSPEQVRALFRGVSALFAQIVGDIEGDNHE